MSMGPPPPRIPGDYRFYRDEARRRRRRARLRNTAVVTGALVVALVALVATEGFGHAKRPPPSTTTSAPPSTSPPTSHAPTTTPTTAPPSPVWRVAWASGMAFGFQIGQDTTVRELATVAIGGSAVQVRISNLFGSGPLAVGAATVGQQASGASVVAGTLHPLTFGGAPGTTIAKGGFVVSDPLDLAVTPGETLSISVYVSNADQVTLHPCCTTQPVRSYVARNGAGNLTASVSTAGFVVASPYPRWVDAVNVLQPPGAGKGSIVVVGDSITDGYRAPIRWTDVLQERIDTLPVGERRAVINEGITANALTADVPTDAQKGGGPSGLARLSRDALSLPGVSEVVLFLGTNDLWFGASAQDVISGMRQAIAAAHKAGVKIVGVTLLPRSSSPPTIVPNEPWTPAQQAALQAVNQWILTSGSFDGVLDFATVAANVYNGACTPTVMFPPYNSGDNLHPDAAGQTALADSIDTTLLGLPATPEMPALVAVSPTPGCAGVPGIPSATPPTTLPVAPTTTAGSPSTASSPTGSALGAPAGRLRGGRAPAAAGVFG